MTDLSKVILSLLIIIIIITHFIGKIRWYSWICSLVKGSNFVQCLFLQRLPAYTWSLTDFKHSSYNVRSQYTLTFAAGLVHTELEFASIQKWMQILCFHMQYGPIEWNVVVRLHFFCIGLSWQRDLNLTKTTCFICKPGDQWPWNIFPVWLSIRVSQSLKFMFCMNIFTFTFI